MLYVRMLFMLARYVCMLGMLGAYVHSTLAYVHLFYPSISTLSVAILHIRVYVRTYVLNVVHCFFPIT